MISEQLRTVLPSMNLAKRWPLALGALGATLLVMGVLYWQTWASMASIWWRSDTYAHGMLVGPIVLYLIWTRLDVLRRLQPAVEPLGLIPLVLLVLLWLAAWITDVLVVQQFALVAMLPALCLILLGRKVSGAIAFPLAYLFFAVPVGDFLVEPLMDFTAWFTVQALRFTGIPVFWEGRYLTIPSGDFEVAEACSGLRYLIASLALGCLYAYLTYTSLWRRLVFIAMSLVVPIIANGMRAYGIVILAHVSDRRLAVGVDHLIYGWLFFGLVVMLMFWIGSWWRQPEDASPPVQAGTASAVSGNQPSRLVLTGAAAVVILAVGALGATWMSSDFQGRVQLPLAGVALPGAPVNAAAWTPEFVGTDAQVRQAYRLEDGVVSLYVAYYYRQRQGAELVNSVNTLYDPKRWVQSGAETRRPEGSGHDLREVRVVHRGRYRMIWHWYWVAGHTTTSDVMAKLWEAWARLSGSGQGSAMVAVATDYKLSEAPQARQRLKRFLEMMQPQIEAGLKNPEIR